ncbi:hypothetical protein ACHAXT_003632 [Thalassiosira profunda]
MSEVMAPRTARVGPTPASQGIKTIEPGSDLTTLPTDLTSQNSVDPEMEEFHRLLKTPGDGDDGGDSDSDDDTAEFDKSLSLTDLNLPKSTIRKLSGHPSDHLHHYNTPSGGVNNATMSPSSSALNLNVNSHEEDVENVTATPGESPLPNPPRHFLCPIQNTLLADPVIDKEGNTYERGAILRWLVLTSTTFSADISNTNGESDADFDGDAKFDSSGEDLGAFLRGTSPITGNPLSVAELREDKVVKAAIERWRKEAWVRFLLGNKEGGGIDLQALMGNETGQKTAKSGKGNVGGSSIHDMIQWESGLHDAERLKGSVNSASPKGGQKKTKASAGEFIPATVSPSSSPAKSSGRNKPPPPPPKKHSKTPPRQHSQRSSHSSSKSAGKGSIKLSHSQVTSVTSNMTPFSELTPTQSNKHRAGVNAANLPAPPLASLGSKPPISPRQSSSPEQALDESPMPRKESVSVPSSVPAVPSSGSSVYSNLSNYDLYSMPMAAATVQPRQQFNGWSVPLGVHKVVCRAPGLRVTTQIHRRSIPVKVNRDVGAGADIGRDGDSTEGRMVKKELVVPPGSYVEVLETQVHGERVRGRISWEEEEEDTSADAKKKKKKSLKKRTSRLLKRTKRKKDGKEIPMITVMYEGWISLQWAKSEEEREAAAIGEEDGEASMAGRATDEDAGPWTEPVPLGVYRVNFAGGLPLRSTPERDSPVVGKLDRGRCVEVVETQVRGDRVRARLIVPEMPCDEESKSEAGGGSKFKSGWISLLNALTGNSGASPVPLGAYVVVAEPGCVITEGGRLDSKVKGTLVPGSCIEVVATRMEEGVVRGLIDGGGHVTLFVPPGVNRGGSGGASTGGKTGDGGRMFAMPVPLGTYQIIHAALPVTSGISPTSPVSMKLPLNATAEVVETRVEDGRVRGRICAVVNEDGSRVASTSSVAGSTASDACGWINLFEPERRWAKIVCFRGGRPVGGGSLRRSSQKATV